MERRTPIPHFGGAGGRRAWLGALTLLTLFKLWLDSGLGIKAESAPAWAWDDALYVRLAGSLLSGDWLGPYDQFTLSKSPLYPAWLALVHSLGVPLLVAQSALYAAVGLLLLRELPGAGMGRGSLLPVYGLYLFNPFVEIRVLREGVYASLLVLLFASLLRLRRGLSEGTRGATVGATLLGVALAAIWLTREEGLLVLPAVGMFYLAFFAGLRKPGPTPRVTRLLTLLAPFLVLGAATLGVCLANAHRYGVFAITEQGSSAFASAFGSMMRVEQTRPIPYVLVPWEVRKELYHVSPALASIQPFLDGTQGSTLGSARFMWIFNPCDAPLPCPEYAGLFFMWAFRQAASDAGYHRSGEDAMRFYGSVADEISRACETGALRCGPPRNSIVPPWRPFYAPALAQTLVLGTATVLSLPVRDYVFDPDAPEAVSNADPQGLERFSRLTQNRLLPMKGSSPEDASPLSVLDREKLTTLRMISTVYRTIFPFFVFAGLLAFLVTVAVAAWRRRGSLTLLLATALLVSIAVRLVALSYISICMFPAFSNWPAYITPLYPLLILFAAVSLGEAMHIAAGRFARPRALQEGARVVSAPPQGRDG
jgi:hypothetical protein